VDVGEQTGASDTGYEFAGALFGATCAASSLVAGVALDPVTWGEWTFLEKTDVATEMAGQWIFAEQVGIDSPVRPPPCLRMRSPTFDDWERCSDRIGLAVLALRLTGARTFLDPGLTVMTAVRGPLINRRVGPYRMFGYSMLADPRDAVDADRAAEATRLVELVESRGAQDLLRPVRDMCAPVLSPSAAALVALQLIEGIYGPMSWPIDGLAFDERLACAGVPEVLVAWMCGGAPDSGRAIRNAVAHGRPTPEAAGRLIDFACVAARAFLELEPDPAGADPVERFRRAAWSNQ
jgi:hypothetical protein